MRRILVLAVISLIGLRVGLAQADVWRSQTVDSAGSVGYYTSLALDSFGSPRISYLDETNEDLKYAAWNGSSWVIETVDSAGNMGGRSSLALDSFGFAHISYADVTNADLKYAAWNGSAWDFQTIDSAGGVGADTSLALDSFGFAHISYSDYTNGNLKYATNAPEPATIALFGLGLLGIGTRLRRRKHQD